MTDSQAEHELAVFEHFAAAIRLPIVSGSIRKCYPPAPDVACEVSGVGPLAFELVEVVDSNIARAESEQLTLQNALHRECGALEETERQRLEDVLRDALVAVSFRNGASRTARRQSVPHIIKCMLSVDREYTGPVPCPAVNKTVRRVSITRRDFTGPAFHVDAATWFDDPLLDCLSTKFAKRYESDAPTHLVAFYERQPSYPRLADEEARDLIHSELAESDFEKVWVYSVIESAVLLEVPDGAEHGAV